MKIPNPYFENIPNYGDLIMEQIIVEYIYPLLSVLKDKNGIRYLCMCFDTRGSQQWLIAPIPITNLIKLLTNKLTLIYPFRDGTTEIVLATRNYDTRTDSFQVLSPNEIPEENFPADGEFLDAEEGEWDSYILKLNSEAEIWHGDSKENTFYSRLFGFVVKFSQNQVRHIKWNDPSSNSSNYAHQELKYLGAIV